MARGRRRSLSAAVRDVESQAVRSNSSTAAGPSPPIARHLGAVASAGLRSGQRRDDRHPGPDLRRSGRRYRVVRPAEARHDRRGALSASSRYAAGRSRRVARGWPTQVPATEEMTYKVMALTRLACPRANIPATTALATLNTRQGRELGLVRGANVVMPNLTPPKYRALYEIYPDKACIAETGEACHHCLTGRIVPSVGSPAKAAAIRRITHRARV